jgi:nitrite reductase/ring-hydroxylating ferredoxin subunit
MAIADRQLLVCASDAPAEKNYLIVDLLYRGAPHSGSVFRYNGEVFACLNQCVHMPRALNCERDTIFDEQRELLRCSMHGIVYDPVTGESQGLLTLIGCPALALKTDPVTDEMSASSTG